MLREEKLVQQAVYLKQPLTIETQVFGIGFEKSLRRQAMERIVETLPHIDAELSLKVIVGHAAELHLQDELADHPLFVVGSERAINRQLAAAHAADVWLPIRL